MENIKYILDYIYNELKNHVTFPHFIKNRKS